MRHVESQPDKPDNKPLTEPVLLILLSFAKKPLHGYGLLQDIEMLSNGRVRLSTGTLYGALRRLLGTPGSNASCKLIHRGISKLIGSPQPDENIYI